MTCWPTFYNFKSPTNSSASPFRRQKNFASSLWFRFISCAICLYIIKIFQDQTLTNVKDSYITQDHWAPQDKYIRTVKTIKHIEIVKRFETITQIKSVRMSTRPLLLTIYIFVQWRFFNSDPTLAPSKVATPLF